jgi:hypothetical protein
VQFSAPAIEKAKALDISCCNLLRNAKPQLPQQLPLQSYVVRPRLGIAISKPIDPFWSLKTMKDVFQISTSFEGKKTTLLDIIADTAAEKMKASVHNGVAKPWEYPLTIGVSENTAIPSLTVTILGKWRYFRGRLDAHLLNGTYSFTDQKFIGRQTFPIIDTQGSHPGEGWEEIETGPTNLLNTFVASFTNSAEQVKEQFASNLGETVIPAD